MRGILLFLISLFQSEKLNDLESTHKDSLINNMNSAQASGCDDNSNPCLDILHLEKFDPLGIDVKELEEAESSFSFLGILWRLLVAFFMIHLFLSFRIKPKSDNTRLPYFFDKDILINRLKLVYSLPFDFKVYFQRSLFYLIISCEGDYYLLKENAIFKYGVFMVLNLFVNLNLSQFFFAWIFTSVIMKYFSLKMFDKYVCPIHHLKKDYEQYVNIGSCSFFFLFFFLNVETIKKTFIYFILESLLAPIFFIALNYTAIFITLHLEYICDCSRLVDPFFTKFLVEELKESPIEVEKTKFAYANFRMKRFNGIEIKMLSRKVVSTYNVWAYFIFNQIKGNRQLYYQANFRYFSEKENLLILGLQKEVKCFVYKKGKFISVKSISIYPGAILKILTKRGELLIFDQENRNCMTFYSLKTLSVKRSFFSFLHINKPSLMAIHEESSKLLLCSNHNVFTGSYFFHSIDIVTGASKILHQQKLPEKVFSICFKDEDTIYVLYELNTNLEFCIMKLNRSFEKILKIKLSSEFKPRFDFQIFQDKLYITSENYQDIWVYREDIYEIIKIWE